MSKERSFPPGIGWLPASIAIVVATVAAVFAVVPQFASRTVALAPGTSVGVGGGTTDGTTAGGPGVSGHTVIGPGGPGSGGTNGGGGGQKGSISCAAGRNGGNSAPGVTGSDLHIASTIVTTGVGSGFLGEAVDGMQAAINEANTSGGVCGRHITLDTVNSGWDASAGSQAISNYINAGNIFALVGEPDSEGLRGAIESGTIDRAGIPVVGSDGMLADQYKSQWVFPVAASTVTNMHVIADYAVHKLGAHSFGIVYDTQYRFGVEGAAAFNAEVHRLTNQDIPGHNSSGCGGAYCGISSKDTSYSSAITTFNKACAPCDVVVMLLEPQPMETWMKGEENAPSAWYSHLMGGEPLFDDNFAATCGQDCANMTVWSGYHPALQPFDSEKPVYTYAQSLKSTCPSCDPHNEFTEGAYLGTRVFIVACQHVSASGLPLTRDTLRQALDSTAFDLGLSTPLHFGSLPHLANISMAAFSDNASGSFNGWNYTATGFLKDPAPGQDL